MFLLRDPFGLKGGRFTLHKGLVNFVTISCLLDFGAVILELTILEAKHKVDISGWIAHFLTLASTL